VQERLGHDLAQAIDDELAPRGVVVILEAAHQCMSLRGARKHGSTTTTIAARGEFNEPARRAEVLALIRAGAGGSVTAPAPPPARVVVTGATGFLGRALCLRLLGGGHSVVAWARDPGRARDLLGGEVGLAGGDAAAMAAAIDGVDVVVHLAGEPVLPGRWSAARKKALTDSRVGLTSQVVAAIGALPADRRPRALLSASAVGFYGDRGEERLDEQSDAGRGFLAELCVQWEGGGARGRGPRHPLDRPAHRRGARRGRRRARQHAPRLSARGGRPAGQRPAALALDPPR
jgi:hypothetical protein